MRSRTQIGRTTLSSLERKGLCDLTLADLNGGRTMEDLFGRQAPVELEIGCGKGRFIIRSAQSEPGRDFIAVELASAFHRVAMERGNRRGLTNLRLICADALYLVRHVLPDASLQAVHILFPDPWPKRRHHKRRVFRPGFMNSLLRVLQDGGTLNAASDHEGYWQDLVTTLDAVPAFSRQGVFALDARLPEGEVGHTNYEVKYRRSGRRIQQGTWLRTPR